MRIALVTPYPPSTGTLNEYAYHFVRALRLKPEVSEVLLLSDHLEDGAAYPVESENETGCAPLTIIPCWRFNDPFNAIRILQAIRKAKPDSVLFNLQFASFGNAKIAASLGLTAPWLVKTAGFPTIVLLHNIMETVDLKTAGFGGNPLMERAIRLFGKLATRILLGADRVALTIPKYVEILIEQYGADNVLLAPHGAFDDVDAPVFELPAGPKQVMAFGKFGTYKRVERMIEAVEKLEAQGIGPLEVIVAGTDSPNAAGYLQSVRKQYAHMNNVHYTGYVEEVDVPRIFSDAAVVVFPYTSTTGSSGVLHQAGSFGKAAVLPKIGDFAEVISEEGYDGEFFEPDDVDSLAQAIARVVEDPERRKELGMRNYLASRGLPIADVVDWYLLHFQSISGQSSL